ncbi:hypothetical protein BBJ29_006213 [Phytophthora kernoviae]|uniref:Uncharacterized protein n=1 Tax=Phytophthora kernoviae TaxID=325452 RepID=A0A3F2RLD6_9STRA|nr:hypothetical protein BBJ29_006213 [Phytophthora kernoviae]RLN59756.1 hypothetical protein BBP00_00006332 [Phytophthora kernoviae]
MEDAAPHVLLYFDVNKTLIMHDPVQGKALPHILNDLLTERAYGRVIQAEDGVTQWLWDGQEALKEHHLQEREVKFNLIFRTFGNDLHRVAQEFNCFCEGRHPCFPLATAMDGSGGGIDRRIHLHTMNEGESPRFGTFMRTEGTTALIMGTFEQPKAADDADPLAFYASSRRWRELQATLALRDFYPYWFQNSEIATAGKLLTLDPADEGEHVHAMFFDDNILPHDAHIVDARFVDSDTAVPFEDTQELHLLRVEPLDVIQSEAYLVSRFEASLELWREKKDSNCAK